MPLDLTALQTEVAEIRTVAASAETLIRGLAQKVRDTAGDPAAVADLANQLDSTANSLAAAVAENTENPA